MIRVEQFRMSIKVSTRLPTNSVSNAVTIQSSAALANQSFALAKICFASEKVSGRSAINLPTLHSGVEIWPAFTGLQFGQIGACDVGFDNEWMFASLIMQERDFVGLKKLSEESFRRVLQTSANNGFPFVIRTWSYFGAINDGGGDEERYKQFCSGRAKALGRTWFDAEPAATVIGSPFDDGQVITHWIAAKTPGMAIDNPRQTAPRDYPKKFGKDAPQFSRAMLWRGAYRHYLLISGTASVVGHETMHHDDVTAQFGEIIRNLDALLLAAQSHTAKPLSFARDTCIRVYVRDAVDMALVQHLAKAAFGNETAMSILNGDICRRELLVEIEAVMSLDS
jgi:chorismate lyase / 3-hydroxybenzoate synthase